MRIFLTGATGFIGSYLVPELVAHGHRVAGLSRSDEGAEALDRANAEAVRGDIDDLDALRAAAREADAVVHAAFDHDFSRVKGASETDRKVIAALGGAMAGSDRPLIVTSGTGLARSKTGDPVVETDDNAPSTEFPRAATEEAADAVIADGCRVIVMRLSQVHDTRHQGRIAQHIRLAREKGFVAYVGEGGYRLSAVHVTDAVRLYRMAIEAGRSGARYHAVAEEGIAMRDIAEALGAGLDVPVMSIQKDEARDYFGPLADLAALDLAASSAATRRELGWEPTGPGLLADLRAMDYAA